MPLSLKHREMVFHGFDGVRAHSCLIPTRFIVDHLGMLTEIVGEPHERLGERLRPAIFPVKQNIEKPMS